jgi:NhaP-type Na+/H+ or K+/H+ antiporter
LIHITLTLTTAYGAFIVADHFLQASGIMALLGAGLTIGYYGPGRFKRRVKDYLDIFWEDAAFVANSLIFLMLGLSEKVFLAHTHANVSGLLVPVLILVLIVIFARGAIIFGLTPLLNAIPGASPISNAYKILGSNPCTSWSERWTMPHSTLAPACRGVATIGFCRRTRKVGPHYAWCPKPSQGFPWSAAGWNTACF